MVLKAKGKKTKKKLPFKAVVCPGCIRRSGVAAQKKGGGQKSCLKTVRSNG
jgi:hypothetical protein